MMEACRDAETPEPVIRVEARGFWFEFPFSPDYMESVLSGDTTQKTTQKRAADRILDILREDPTASRRGIAATLGDITENGVKYHLDKLKGAGRIRRVGPDRGGHWEIVKPHDE